MLPNKSRGKSARISLVAKDEYDDEYDRKLWNQGFEAVSRNLKFTEILFTIFVNDILRTFLNEQMRAIIKYESGRIRAFYLLFSLTYLLSIVQLNGIDENLSTHRPNDQFFNPTPFESSHFVARQKRKKLSISIPWPDNLEGREGKKGVQDPRIGAESWKGADCRG